MREHIAIISETRSAYVMIFPTIVRGRLKGTATVYKPHVH